MWDALDDLDTAFGVHLYGTAPAMRDDVQSRYTGQPNCELAITTMNGIYQAQSAIPELIGSGVLERHPNIRPLIMEVASSWLVWLLEKMDGMWEMYGPDTDTELSMTPSEYFKRQMFVTVECDEDALPFMVERGLGDTFVFSTDYPHHDSPWPNGVGTLLSQPISDDVKRRILWDNAQQLFRARQRVS
jgi:predicted TIM-barrel fold metal-dependent hydrolase